MKFLHPDILFFLWAVLPVSWLLVLGIGRRKKIMARFADPALYPSLLPGFNTRARWVKAILVVFALIPAVFALAGPLMGFRWEKTTARGVDIMIALDCSRSMLAQDIKPSRLERAKREIIDLLRLMRSDRAGLVAFAGRAILQCPLTLDHEAFHIFLDVLSPDYLPVGGTDLNAAIEACFNGFEADADTDKAIILITDGENTAGDVSKIAEKMAQNHIKVFCIGVGDPSGAPIPDPNGGFKKDGQGNIVLSRVNEEGLKSIASRTNAAYVRSVAGDMDLDLIYTQHIRGGMAQKTLEQGKKKVWENRFQWFLFPCVVLLLIELWLPVTRKKAARLLTAAAICLAVAGGWDLEPAAAFSGHVKKGMDAYGAGDFEASRKHFIDAQLENPEDLRLYYNIGAAAYKTGAFEEAEKHFEHAAQSRDAQLRHKALFNRANAQYRQGRLDEAIKGYETVLASFPDDEKAKENLEFARQKKKEQEQNQQCRNPGDKNDPDTDQKDEDKQRDKDKQKDKDPDNKDKQQDKKEQDKQKEQQGQDGQTDQQKGQRDPSQKQDDMNRDPAENPPEPQPDQGEESGSTGDEPEPEQAPAARAKPGEPGEPGEKALENRLNRLEDKPGMALMPRGGPRDIEKDW